MIWMPAVGGRLGTSSWIDLYICDHQVQADTIVEVYSRAQVLLSDHECACEDACQCIFEAGSSSLTYISFLGNHNLTVYRHSSANAQCTGTSEGPIQRIGGTCRDAGILAHTYADGSDKYWACTSLECIRCVNLGIFRCFKLI